MTEELTQTAAVASPAEDAHARSLDANGQEFLTFKLGSEEYGVDILKVQEIRGYDTVTRIPDAPECVKGVINLRGTIVPVIDLRVKFKIGNATYDELTVMIILNLGERVIGIVVDGVSDVLSLATQQIQPPPDVGGVIKSDYITGIGTIEDRMLILVDIEHLMSRDELAVVEQAVH